MERCERIGCVACGHRDGKYSKCKYKQHRYLFHVFLLRVKWGLRGLVMECSDKDCHSGRPNLTAYNPEQDLIFGVESKATRGRHLPARNSRRVAICAASSEKINGYFLLRGALR
jgi:hypothetical protein